MISQFAKVFSDSSTEVRSKLFGIYSLLIALNVLAWTWAVVAFRNHPLLLGTALLAYGFGLRHAVDADHIAAIDNVTRKLMQEKKRPVAVGFFFSLGHSTVVVLASVAVAITASAMQTRFDHYKEIGGVIGTLVSALFLFAIALMNLIILKSIYSAWRHVRNGGKYVEDDFDMLLADRGFLSRLFRPLFRLITRSWHMYPLGFLFGLGFDTATEIGLLGIAATQASRGLSPWAIMVFPVLFSAGMSLIDTLDGHLMLGAYGWAYLKPIRKIYYNMTITLVSVIVAVVIGGIEALGLIADQLKLQGPVWDAVGTLNENFGTLGYIIIGIFVLSWIASVLIYRAKRFDELEVSR
ncbi:HoxN/HupN/NixA family nickel/cobalt transporter [Paraburkholderia fungorum]|jgi:high-affinity nickel-transport protein|uniref:HoxN/HupN/NixA family nickel/cobalt transporter n=1 Tax=Paraburkholderia fungorum TaxID=134537 RepID=UPI0015B4E1B5|nr:HoxN/HupN/NixA family nickel/cobalt transporter [Paraburkholderia fungorum]MBU7441247.1 HoxN/HupN/NixA family nickel/cobalt transporter [Paraburkholderia fungorum]QLD50501.1 HoxN/HupN/NixA family nickel/cobalt transporter [Paraburkholderia fungorum]